MLSVASCSGDDDKGDDGNNGGNSNTDPIVGTWKLYGAMENGVVTSDNIEPCDDEIYKFKSNGDLTITEKFCGEGSDTYTVNWERTGENLYKFVAEGQPYEAYYIAFTEDGKYAYLFESVEEMQSQSYAEVFKKS